MNITHEEFLRTLDHVSLTLPDTLTLMSSMYKSLDDADLAEEWQRQIEWVVSKIGECLTWPLSDADTLRRTAAIQRIVEFMLKPECYISWEIYSNLCNFPTVKVVCKSQWDTLTCSGKPKEWVPNTMAEVSMDVWLKINAFYVWYEGEQTVTVFPCPNLPFNTMTAR